MSGSVSIARLMINAWFASGRTMKPFVAAVTMGFSELVLARTNNSKSKMRGFFAALRMTSKNNGKSKDNSNSKSNSKDNSKSNSKGNSKNNGKNNGKNNSKNNSKNNGKNNSRNPFGHDNTKGNCYDNGDATPTAEPLVFAFDQVGCEGF